MEWGQTWRITQDHQQIKLGAKIRNASYVGSDRDVTGPVPVLMLEWRRMQWHIISSHKMQIWSILGLSMCEMTINYHSWNEDYLLQLGERRKDRQETGS